MSCTSRFSIVTAAVGASWGCGFGRGVTGSGVTGAGVVRGVGSGSGFGLGRGVGSGSGLGFGRGVGSGSGFGFGRGVASGSGMGRGFGFGFGVASGDGVAGTVRISSRALRNWRRFSASSSGRDCWARKPAPAITMTTTSSFKRTRTRRMLMQSPDREKREVRAVLGMRFRPRMMAA